MSKKRHRSNHPKKAIPRNRSWTSFAIPTLVGLIVLAVIVGAVLAFEGGQRDSSGSISGLPEGVSTAQALPSNPIPYPEVPRITVQAARALLDSGEAILIDVRSKTSYDQSHAEGAISVPEAEVNNRLSELSREQTLILYCT